MTTLRGDDVAAFAQVIAHGIAKQQAIDNLGDCESVVLMDAILNLHDLAQACNAAEIMETLRFYADEKHHGRFHAVESDNGYRARRLLDQLQRHVIAEAAP